MRNLLWLLNFLYMDDSNMVLGVKKLISFKVLILFQLLSGFLIEITKGIVEEIFFKMSLTIIYTPLSKKKDSH